MSDSRTGANGEPVDPAQPDQPDQPAARQPEPQGQPGAPDSGAKRGNGRIMAIAAGALVLVGAAIGGVVLFNPGADTKYELTTPKTLAGEYERDGEGQKGDGRAFGKKKVPGMESSADVSAEYKAGTTKKLQLGGAYGSVQNPEKAVDWVFEQSGKSLKTETGAKTKGKLETFSPAGFDGDVLKCREYRISSMSLAMCGWADASTVGTVTSMNLTSDGTSTLPVNLEKSAELVAEVRKEALVEQK